MDFGPANDDGTARALLASLRQIFASGTTRPLAWRQRQLEGVLALLEAGRAELVAAMRQDLGKPIAESETTEIDFVAAAVTRLRRDLPRLLRPERVRVPLLQRPARASVRRDPYGVALVIAPWNFPVQLLLLPIASALAAGNCVIGSPSPLAPATAAALGRLAARHLDTRAVALLEPSATLGAALVAAGPDYVFFTGSSTTGRKVMAAAATHLVPMTLELGGKNPAIVDASADLEVAARRLAFGRFLNAGQTCVSPDYVLVEEPVAAALVDALATEVGRFYGVDPRRSPDYGRIVNDTQFERLVALVAECSDAVVFGGECDPATRYLAPTVVRDPDPSSGLLREEIFGPVLPIVTVASLDEAIARVRAAPKPLALYLFSSDTAHVARVRDETSSGAFCVNATTQHLAVPGLPFGGVGASGMGAYHGRVGLETFTHPRAVLERPGRPDPAVAYPPYGRLKRFLLRRAL